MASTRAPRCALSSRAPPRTRGICSSGRWSKAWPRALGTHGAWVTEYLPESRRLRALAFWLGGEWILDFEHLVDGTPCEDVIDGRRLVHIADNALDLYPNNERARALGAVSYLGVPLLDVDGSVLGHLAVLDRRPMPAEPRAEALIRIFAARAAAELQRLRAETEVREREEKLTRLVDSAMDAIVELDEALRVTRVNPAAEKLFGHAAAGERFPALSHGRERRAARRRWRATWARAPRASAHSGFRRADGVDAERATSSRPRRRSRASTCGAAPSTRSSCAT